jgi:Tetratricopeptide repeat
VLGASYSSTVDSRNKLAMAYLEVGRVGEAVRLYERVLADSERALGASHPSTIKSRDNLAMAYREAGRAGEAPQETSADEKVTEFLARNRSTYNSVQDQAAEIADTVRRIERVVGTEVTDCPRLFTLASARPAGGRRALIRRNHYRLTLWCEHPGYEHPWGAAVYDLDPPKEWFTRIAPYATLVFRTLRLIVPLSRATAASLAAAEQTDAQAHLEMMEDLVADLPAMTDARAEDSRGETVSLTSAEGEALRALRAIVFEHDPQRVFGGLLRVQAPSGDLLWVCENHYPDYDLSPPVVL